MKTIYPVFIFFFFSFALPAQDRKQISNDLFFIRLQEDVYMITHIFPRYGSNSLFVILPGQKGVLIDTPHETTGTRTLLDWIDSTFGELELVVINTGWHQDNLGGNEYLRSEGIDIYGADLTAALITKRQDELKSLLLESTRDLEEQRYYESYRKLVLIPPNILFPLKEGLKLEFGKETFEVFFPGESHTIDNTVVFLHERKILFGGCMVLSLQHQRPGFIDHANMSEWPISVKRVIRKFPSCKTVIPGHGRHGDASLLDHTVEILERFNMENPD